MTAPDSADVPVSAVLASGPETYGLFHSGFSGAPPRARDLSQKMPQPNGGLVASDRGGCGLSGELP